MRKLIGQRPPQPPPPIRRGGLGNRLPQPPVYLDSPPRLTDVACRGCGRMTDSANALCPTCQARGYTELTPNRCQTCGKSVRPNIDMCINCILAGRDTDTFTVDVGPGEYSQWTLPDGRTVHFTPVIMSAKGQLVITVSRGG